MEEWLVIVAQWPIADVPAVSAIYAQTLGGAASDAAQLLRRCRGIVAERLSESDALQLADHLTRSGIAARAFAANRLPDFARPVVAKMVDLRDPDALIAQISITGPPERIPFRHVVLTLPGRWQTSITTVEQAKKKGVSMVGLAMDLAMTGGVKTMLQSRPGTKEPDKVIESKDDEPMLELATVAPGRRIHVFARRLDYRNLMQQQGRVEDNWRQWLQELQARVRPGVAGADRLQRVLAGAQAPRDTIVSDVNDLGRTAKWLMFSALQ